MFCDPKLEGNSCNGDMEEVARKFSSGFPQPECFACEYYETSDGEFLQKDVNVFYTDMICHL